jgi:hypothetical protein
MRLTVLCLLTLVSFAVNAAPYQFDTESRVVAFADVHGAYDDFTALLREVEVIDEGGDWIGGDTNLVSLGDLIDRGPGSRQVLELLMKLQQQAEAAGGAVRVVLGNHEVMVMSGDTRYVSRTEYAAFAPDESGAEREALLDSYRESLPDLSEEEVRLRFEKLYPPGYLGLQKAYAPDGSLGQWLMTLPLVIRVNDSLYMHGGISNAIADSTLKQINEDNKHDLAEYLRLVESLRGAGVLSQHVGFWDRRLHLNAKAEAMLAADPKARPDWFNDFAALAELEDAFIFSPESPVWYRGSAYCHPYSESFNTERLLKRVGATQLVIGHTPNPRGVFSRLDGTVIRLDTGMLKAVYKGRASALIQAGGEKYVHYLGVAEAAQPVAMTRSVSQELWQMSDQELEDLLRQGQITSSEFIGTGITKPKKLTIEYAGKIEAAAFKYEDSAPRLESRKSFIKRRYNDADRYQYDPAAYRLDRILDLQMVPVAVIRTVDGKEGAVSAWMHGTINERDRLEQNIPFGGYCAKDEQYRLRFLFDILIYNEDRNLTNILWTKKDFMLQFIDQSLAFRIDNRRPKQYKKVTLRLSDLTARRFQALNEQSLQQELGDYLHPRQIEAIIDRRDLIMKEAVRTGR